MTLRSALIKVVQQEDLNFLLTNRLPRRWATLFVGWLSRLEQPLVRDACLLAWRLFCDLDLSEARTTRFKSLHDCFTRELQEGARPVDAAADVLVSPCDAIVGASGWVTSGCVLQAKGFPYALSDLLGDDERVRSYAQGSYVTLRLTAGMYHRFHAPHDCRIDRVIYVSGDTWNVNPIALKRIERLFCKNERAIVPLKLAANGQPLTLVAVAAILVASIRLHCLGGALNREHRGPNVLACDAQLRKGAELGWFEHGSTIIVFAPATFSLCDNVRAGATIRVGEPLMRLG